MRNLRSSIFNLGLILIVVFNANASNSRNEMNRNEEDGAVYYKIKSQSGKEYITKYLNFAAGEMVKIYDVSPEETDRILGKSSVRRHLRILEIKKGLRLYSLSELLDLYKIDKNYRSFSVVNDGRVVDAKWEVISTKSGVHSVDVDVKNKRITITSTIMKSVPPLKPGDIILR